MKKLKADKKKVWDKLNYVPRKFVVDYDINSLYATQVDTVFCVTKDANPTDVLITVKKNR